jgi:pyruvate dehydrogenase E2 component (dihydrolipoamide acetyltransferase)
MATEIKLPVLGENVDSGTVVKVLVSPGDRVTEDQAVLDLDTDKASVEVPAAASGTVKEIRVKEGETVKVGQVLMTLEEAAETKEAKPTPRPEQAPQQPEAEQEFEGTAEKHEIEEPKPVAPQRPKTKPEVVPFRKEKAQPAAQEPVAAAPIVRRVARELGIDINEVNGTGPGGRITEADARNYARSIILNATVRKSAVQRAALELPDFARWGEIDRQPMTPVRRKTAQHVMEAWTSIPHVTHFDTADITDLERLRDEFADEVEQAGGKLTITSILVKIVAAALQVFPQFNASVVAEQEEIIYKKYYNIGVAVDTDRGLLVPVIRDAADKNILELSVELSQLAEKARNRKLSADEMQGGTFTITNLGGISGSAFTPIINSPEVAILGIARANHQAVYRDGQFEPRRMLPLCVSFDHRVIDGADAARFLRWIGDALEEPFKLTLEG